MTGKRKAGKNALGGATSKRPAIAKLGKKLADRMEHITAITWGEKITLASYIQDSARVVAAT